MAKSGTRRPDTNNPHSPDADEKRRSKKNDVLPKAEIQQRTSNVNTVAHPE